MLNVHIGATFTKMSPAINKMSIKIFPLKLPNKAITDRSQFQVSNFGI